MLRRHSICSLLTLMLGCGAYTDTADDHPIPGDRSSRSDAQPTDAEDRSTNGFTALTPVLNADASSITSSDPPPTGSIRIARSERFDGYLSTASGQPLYMSAADMAGARTTTCLDECAKNFPPYDDTSLSVSAGLNLQDFSRFHRDDGAWQIAYKGHPLYLRAREVNGPQVSGDGIDGNWFVARDYLAFLAVPRNFEPAGGTSAASHFLTDGFGRTLYICLDDRPASTEASATSSCTGTCITTRPPFFVGATRRSTMLPSVLDPRDLRVLERPDGTAQVTYRGWPLYYYQGDSKPGDTAGHNEKAWRAIDPTLFTNLSGNSNF